MKLKKLTILSMCLLINFMSADDIKHQVHITSETYSGDIDSKGGLNIGYTYEWGEEWRYGLGTDVTLAKDANQAGDAINFTAKMGKKIFNDTSAFGFIGLTGMATGFKKSSNDEDVAAGGINYGFLINCPFTDTYSMEFGYRGYNLEYKIDSQEKSMHIDSLRLSLVYTF